MVVVGQSGCIWAKVVVLGQKWYYSGQSCFIRTNGCIRAKWLLSEESGCIRAKCLYSAEVVVFVEKWL